MTRHCEGCLLTHSVSDVYGLDKCLGLDDQAAEIERLKSEAIHKATPFTTAACLNLEEIIEEKDADIARLTAYVRGEDNTLIDEMNTRINRLRDLLREVVEAYREFDDPVVLANAIAKARAMLNP